MTIFFFIPLIYSISNQLIHDVESINYGTQKAISANSDHKPLYCMCYDSNLASCKQSKLCDSYSVPLDNYFSHKDAAFWTKLSDLSDSIITIYVTNAQTNQFIISPVNFKDDTVTLKFASIDPDNRTPLVLKGTQMANTNSKFELSIQSLTSVQFDQNFVDHVSTMTIRSTELILSDSIKVSSMITDISSLDTFTGVLEISESLDLLKSSPYVLKGSIVLIDNATLTVDNSAMFPVVSLENGKDGQPMVFLSDEYEDKTLKIGIKNLTGNKNIKFNETTKATITIYNRYTFTDKDETTPDATAQESETPQNPDEVTTEGGTTPSEDGPLNSLNFLFEIGSSGMSVHFNKNPSSSEVSKFPQEFHVVFDNALNDNESVLLELTLDKMNGGSYPIQSISSSLNLRLMTADTINEFFKNKNDYQLASLTVNFENYLSNITYNSESISFGFNSDSSQFHNSKQTDISSINISYNVSNSFYVLTSAEQITFSNESTTIYKITVISENSLTVTFVNNFPINATNITLSHSTNPITIQAESEMPQLNIDDPIINVSYHTLSDVNSTLPICNITNQEEVDSSNLNAGPNVTYNFAVNSITFPQSQCLAETVTFTGNDFTFVYISESVTNYFFENSVSIANEPKSNSKMIKEESTPVKFNAKGVTFSGDNKFNNGQTNPISSTFGNLDCPIGTIPSTSFSEPIKITQSLNIRDSTFSNIYFSPDTVRIDSSATIQQVLNGDAPPTFKVTTTSTDRITLYYEESNSNSKKLDDSNTKSLIKNTTLYLTGNTANIYIDKSWYKVDIDDSFKIVLNSKTSGAKIETNLLNLPPFTFYYQDDNGDLVRRTDIVSTQPDDAKFVGSPAFIVIIVLACVIVIAIIVGIVLCIKFKKSDAYSNLNKDAVEPLEIE